MTAPQRAAAPAGAAATIDPPALARKAPAPPAAARRAPRTDGAVSELEDGEVISPVKAIPETPRPGLTRSDANVLAHPTLDAAAKTALLWRTSPRASPAQRAPSGKAPPPPPPEKPAEVAKVPS